MTKKKRNKTKDNINPSYYRKGKIEVVDFILDQKMSYLEGSVIKYLTRWKEKNGIEDLENAEWFLQKLMKIEEK